ncbi:high-affinity iron permease [Fusarium piperis]|uniref:High-affinity iron permease n=1 Tax=Fusarium piperis TaxID=1435070 RepID=A0A9W8WHF4_9HYPO|nr:high-affinity iron permease [Fusarium piperis]
MLDLFSVPVYVVVFRETLETAIIVSVLLAFLKQTLDGSQRDANLYKALRAQVWLGTATGFALCLIGSGVIIGIFYILGTDAWADHEYYYEGVFSLISAIIITIMGGALLRVGKMEEKWRAKLAKAIEAPVTAHGKRAWLVTFFEKYAMFALPFITVLREGIEGIVFVAGVSFSAPASAVPLPVIMGLLSGGLVGYILYRGGSSAKLQVFLVASTCLLYLVAAGLFSRAIWLFEQQQWNKVVGGDAAELGDGPGSYDIDRSIWHVNCCNPQLNGGGGWAIFNAVLGWNNSATYGSVLAYNLYWIFVIGQFSAMTYKEDHGHWPLMKAKDKAEDQDEERLVTPERAED